MSEQRKSDMVMKFVTKKSAVQAECMLTKDTSDGFMTNFNPATAAKNNLSDFFEITKFDFGMEIKDEDKTKKSLSDKTLGELRETRFDSNTARVKGAFASWRAATDAQVTGGDVKLNLEFETFTFSKLVDMASPVFFEACLNSTTFPSATLVKRTGAGGANPVGFLKMDFTDVLIIGIDWDDGVLVSETCKFICRGFTVQYKPQNADGTFQSVVSADWVASRDSLPEST